MEKEVEKWSSNTRVSPPKPAMNTAEQANLTKPERRLISFPAGMMVPEKSLPAKIQEHKYEEADLNRSLELYQAYKNRDNEFGLEQLSYHDLQVLASFYFTGQVSKEVGAEEQRGDEAASLSLNKVVKPNKDLSYACRDDKFFKNKYVRRKRVGAVSETCNLVKKLCTHKSSTSLFNVDAAEIKQGFLWYNNGEPRSKFEVGQCSRTNNKTEATEAVVYATWKQGFPKKKRSQRKRKPKELKKNLEERRQGNDQVLTCDNFGVESETEEEEKGNVSYARNSSSCNNPWTGFSFNVQWRNKKKRGSVKLKETQSYHMILLVAVEAITNQLRLLDISM